MIHALTGVVLLMLSVMIPFLAFVEYGLVPGIAGTIIGLLLFKLFVMLQV